MRKGFGKEPMRPHNLPFVMLGAACCGSAGSDSTPVRSSRPTRPPVAPSSTRRSPRRSPCSAGSSWRRSATASPPRSVPLPASSRVWSPSRRPPRRSTRGARSPSASSPVWSAPWPSASSTSSATTTRSTSWASTSSAVSWVPLLIGFFAQPGRGHDLGSRDGALNGLFYGGGWTQLGTQAIVALLPSALLVRRLRWSSDYALKYTMGLRVRKMLRSTGIDFAEHGETAYEEAK